jgi:uncharacterized membrane protein YsdA (DUF1294 family)
MFTDNPADLAIWVKRMISTGVRNFTGNSADLAIWLKRMFAQLARMFAHNPAEGLYAAVFLALVLINLVTIASFWRDKQLAIRRERRIPEARLLGYALLGGFPGALLARHLFRHKTRKQPFTSQLWLITVVETGVAVGLLIRLPA